MSLDLAETNELIRRFGACHRTTMRAERRAAMKSVLFDLPRRSSLGWEAVYEHGGALVSELAGAIEPDELGRRMRVVGGRPYTMQPFILLCGYLAARQQHMLDAALVPGEPYAGDDPEEIALVVSYWARLMDAYRNGPWLMPEEEQGATRILDAAQLAEVESLLSPVSDEGFAAARRMAATLELYGFILHGEQRDGICGHGPYALDGGEVLFFKEFNDLRNEHLPWGATETRNPYANVVVAYAAREVTVQCDLFGSMVVQPHEFTERLTAMAVLTNTGDQVRPLDSTEIEQVRAGAAAAQQELYLRAVGWDARYKITYGADLFANHMAPLFELAGIGAGAYEQIAGLFRATAERVVDELARSDVPSVWEHFATSPHEFYWPVASSKPDLARPTRMEHA